MASILPRPQCVNSWTAEEKWFVLSTVATDVLVLKHQAISSRSTGWIFIVLGQFYTEIQWNPSIKATQDDGLSKEATCPES